jgi:serine/threonine-protein kinase
MRLVASPYVERPLDCFVQSADDGAWVVLVFEYGRHGDVQAYLQAHACVSAQLLVVQLMLALRDVHRAGLVHCDVKPENVIMHTESCFRLTDFDEEALGGVEVGTRGFMAPEVAEGLPFDERANLYSAGATLCRAPSARRRSASRFGRR